MPNIDFSKLASLKYWLEGTTAGVDVNIIPVEFGSFFYYFYVSIFSGLIILAILLIIYRLYISQDHPLQSKLDFLSQNLIWMGILGSLWFLARQVEISFVSARLWLIFGFIWFLAVMFWFLRYYFWYYPLELSFYKKSKELKIIK